MKKNKISKIFLVVMMIVTLFPSMLLKAQEQDIETKSNNTTLNIGTYNIAAYQFSNGANQEKFGLMSKQFDDLKLDVIGLQEVDMFNDRNNYDMMDKFKNENYPFVHFAKGRDHANGAFGTGFVSKYDFLEASSSPIDNTGSAATKTSERILIQKDGKEIAVYNIHFSYETIELRHRQMRQVMNRMKNDSAEYKILLGDFNADQNLYEYSMFLGDYKIANGYNGEWFNTFPGVDPDMKVKTIDNIIVSKNINIKNKAMVENDLSDHNMFYAQLELLDEQVVLSDNIALGQLISASSQNNPNNDTLYSALAAVDNDSLTMWQSNVEKDQTITLNLDQMYDVNKLKVHWGNNRPSKYSVEVSSDGLNYSQVYAYDKDELISVDSIDLNTPNAKFLRLVMSERATGINPSIGYEINEIELNGTASGSMTGNNVIQNKGFEDSEEAPIAQLGPANTHWDVGLWENNTKATNWVFQKYPATANSSFYHAKIDKESFKEGGSSVSVSKTGGATGNQAFLKQVGVALDKGKTYEVSFWVKTSGLNNSTFEVNATQKNASGAAISGASAAFKDVVKVDGEWTQYTNYFTTTSTTTNMDMVFKIIANGVGSFWVDDVKVNEAKPIDYIQLSTLKNTIDIGENVSIVAQGFPVGASMSELVWESSDTAVATVDGAGNVTALSEGVVMIHVTSSKLPRLISSIQLKVKGEAVQPTGILQNSGFEESEVSPSVPNGPANTWWNTDLWTNDKKASNWDFQKWKVDKASENFKATLDTETKKSGKQSVKIEVTTSDVNTQAFFKQIKVPVSINTYYDFDFWNKLDNVKGVTLLARVEEYNASNTKIRDNNFEFGKGTSDWLHSKNVFKTSATTAYINVVFVTPSSTTGSYWIDDIVLSEKSLLIEEIQLDQSKMTLSSGMSKKLNYTLKPVETIETDVEWISDDTSIATVDETGLVKGVRAGETSVRLRSKANAEIEASCIVKVVEGDIKVDEIKIVPETLDLKVGQKYFLQYETYPETAVNHDLEVLWNSSNKNVVEVSRDGTLHATGVGSAEISIQSTDDASIQGKLVVTVAERSTKADYVMMKDRWLKRIVGDDTSNLENEYIMDYVETLSKDAEKLWSEMDKSAGRTYLWPLKDGDTESADYTTQFNNLNKLAYAFGTKGSTLEGNRELYFDLISALDFMTINKKYNGSYSKLNWWDWQIGSAQPFTDTLMILSDYMSVEQVKTYASCIAGYAKDPALQWGGSTATGANRTDIGISVLGTAILLEDDSKMELINTKIPPVFKLVTSGDGMYIDGSVVQHNFYAYSGSYGNELMKGIGRILSTVADTEWEIKKDTISNVYETTKNGYLPLMHKGRMMSMMSGRSISRAPGTNKFASEFSGGQETIANIMVISSFAPEQYAKDFDSSAKYWITESLEDYNFFEHARDLEALQNAERIYNNAEITTENAYQGVKVYSMDRVVQQAKNYAIGISMYSSRIGNFELQKQGSSPNIKYENMKGWHQADGALYLYNDDLQTYGNGYWTTADSKRLPGTTVDTKELGIGEKSGTRSPQSWVGGSTDGVNGAVGMYLDKTNTNMDLKAKKSWFILEDQVVAVGSDISGTTSASIETVVENRMLNETKSNMVRINDKLDDGLSKKTVLEKDSWVHLQGNKEGTDIGYYFPDGANVSTVKETNSATYLDINTLFVDNVNYTKNYFKMSIDHGKNVNNGTYAYVLLPGKTVEETKAYAKENSVNILANTADVHAVEDTNNKMFAMNVWKETGFSMNGISVDKPASVIMKEHGNQLKITVSDPKRAGTKIKISLDEDYQEILSMDPNITLASDGKSFEFSSAKTAGASYSVVVKVDRPLDFVEMDEVIANAQAIDEAQYTPNSYSELEEAITFALTAKADAVLQDEVDQAVLKLREAMNALVQRADKTVLIRLVEDVKKLNGDDYLSDGWDAVLSVLATADGIIADENVLQSGVETITLELNTALDALVMKEPPVIIELGSLRTLIDECSGLTEKDYTVESWKPFELALTKAKDALSSLNRVRAGMTQSEVDEIEKELRSTRSLLVKKTQTVETSKPETTTGSNSVKSGDATNIGYVSLLLVGFGAYLVLYLRKRRLENDNMNS